MGLRPEEVEVDHEGGLEDGSWRVSGSSEFVTREGAAEAQRMGSRPRHLPEEGKP